MSDAPPQFSLVYTSVRPDVIPKVFSLWNDRSKYRDIEWVIAVDEGQEKCIQVAQGLKLENCRSVRTVINKGAKNCVAGWNAAAAESTGKVIIAVADDFVPPFEWDEKLAGVQPGWMDGEHVVHTNDGYVFNIFVLSILTRKRYERYGYVFYPKYHSLFCDTEFTEVALRDGVVIEAMHLLFEHMHPDCHKRPRDAHDLKHASPERWQSGEQLFNFRRSIGFPVDDGPKAEYYAQLEKQKQADKRQAPVSEKPAVDPEEFIVYMQLTKDDLCLYEVCKRMAEEGARKFFWAQPDEYWSGEPVSKASYAELDEIAARLRADGLEINQRVFKVCDYKFSNDSRITVETRLRNDSLAWIRGVGYRKILIVDGDELWLRGTLEMIKPYIAQGHIALSCQMIPTAGCPGYPIESATDLAVIYIGGTVNFSACRTPTVRQTVLPLPRIIHFTSTRKTMEETIAKHRRSGHYDDPEYDFEGWIKDKLPHIKPGTTDVHMFKRYQIWPCARHWRPEEIREIPSSIWPYIGLDAEGLLNANAELEKKQDRTALGQPV
jgi:hypothetical protein